MKLAELLRNECISVNSTVDDEALALCEIARLAKKCRVLDTVSEEAILEALQVRETLGTTALGSGVAIPHCRMRDVKDFVVGLMTIPEGVEFGAHDRQKVRLMVFIIAPSQQSDTHIRLLSVISQALQDAKAVQKMVHALSKVRLREAFLEAAGQDISDQVPMRRSMVHVFVQDDKIFRQILEVMNGLENSSMSIMDAQSPKPYLSELPLYKGFAENGNGVCKVIAAVVPRRLSNEVIRRVESVTGSLFECTGVMVTVQELDYAAGMLEV